MGMPPHSGWNMAKGNDRGPLLLHERLGGEHPVLVGGAQRVDVGHRVVGRGHVVLGLPGPVGLGLVEEERGHPLPALLRILGQRHHLVRADGAGAGVGTTQHLHLVAVELPHLGHRGDEPVGDAGRAAAAGSLLPPSETDGPPGRNGAGVRCTVRPRYSKGSPVKAALSVVTVSVTRLARSFMATSNMANSSCTYPPATIRSTRPRLRLSRKIMSSARRSGSWKGAMRAAIMKWTLVVRAAMAASMGIGLGR